MATTAQQYWDALGYGLWGDSVAPLSWEQLGQAGQQSVSDYYAQNVLPAVLGQTKYDILGNPVASNETYGGTVAYRKDQFPTFNYSPESGGIFDNSAGYSPESGSIYQSLGIKEPSPFQSFGNDNQTAMSSGLYNNLRLDGYNGETRLPQASALYAINPELAESLGITREMALNLAYQQDAIQGEAARADKSAADKQGWLMAISTIGTGAGLGYLGYGDAAAGAGAYSAGGGASGAGGLSGAVGYTGTAAELAADGLGGVDMAGNSGAAAYYDSGAGMWIDSTTGEGIASGTQVPAGYTAEAGSSAIAAADAAPAAANEPGILDSLQDWYKKGNNAKTVADALKSFTNSPTQQGSSAYSPLDSFDSGSSSPVSGGVTSGAGQSQLLETQPQTSGQSYSLPTQQQASGPLGMIDVTPANNTFLQAGSTWNQQMANALRKRNAY